MTSPSRLARSAVIGRMAALYNSTYQSLLPSFSGALPVVFDFNLPSTNVLLGEYAIKDVLASNVSSLPLITVYTKNGSNRDPLTKSQLFAGRIMIGVDQFVSMNTSKQPPDFETACDIHEATMLEIFNNPNKQSFWGFKCIYNGELSWVRTAIDTGGRGWLRRLHYDIPIDVDLSS